MTLEDGVPAHAADLDEVLAVDAALRRLAERDPRLVEVVECRFFAGLTEEETAEALRITTRTVQRDWRRAKAWLLVALGAGGEPDVP